MLNTFLVLESDLNMLTDFQASVSVTLSSMLTNFILQFLPCSSIFRSYVAIIENNNRRPFESPQ